VRILLTINRTYRGQIDGGHYNVYLPLQSLGHEVYFYDTVDPVEKNYTNVIEEFKPDLIFCCMTGDKNIAPYEPWKEILKETTTGRTKTFNWFLDDTWRFDNFSKLACKYFNVSSTSEPSYVKKFKDIGYENILFGGHHLNFDIFPPMEYDDKDIDSSFIGFLSPSRERFIEQATSIGIDIDTIHGVTHEELLDSHNRTKIGINLSVNDNDPLRQTQLKLRIFEILAGKGLLLTEYHKGIEEFFEIDKEIVTFKTFDEFQKKFKFLSNRPKLVKKIALRGHNRFLNSHESKVRLKSVLKQIGEL